MDFYECRRLLYTLFACIAVDVLRRLGGWDRFAKRGDCA